MYTLRTQNSKSGGLAQRAYEQLRAALVSGAFAPGEALLESHVAGKLGMSRTPVREALSVLAREGLLEAAPTRGYFVPQRSMNDLREFFELREGLEGMASRYAAMRATDAEIQDLQELCGVYERAPDVDSWTRLGTEFHARIVSMCRNARLAGILDSLKVQIVLTRYSALQNARTRRSESIREHRAILDAIARHDPDAAEEHARVHVRTSYRAILLSFQSGYEPPSFPTTETTLRS